MSRRDAGLTIERRLTRAWYGRPGALRLLSPLEWLYRGVTAARRSLLEHEPAAAPIVIVVGNITVGGTGKTPLVIALARWLREAGYRPGIVSRGYGGRAPVYPFEVTDDTTPDVAGDEACLIARRTSLPVVVAPRRREAVAALLERYRCDVIISDDGLQHYAMARHMEIVVVDGERGLGNGHCMPVGPLREPVARLREADLVVVNGETHDPALGDAVSMTLQPGELVALRSGEHCRAENWPDSRRVHGVAGIGNPARFFRTLAGLGFEVLAHAFPDHHDFRAAELEFADDLPVIMTEKDAVKCRRFARDNWWALGVEAQLPAPFFEAVQARLAQLPGKRNA